MAARTMLCLLLLTASAEAIEVDLRPQCQPRGPVVTVGDVASVKAADPGQAAALAAIELFAAPAPGQCRILRFRELQDILLARQVNLVDVRVSGASEVLIGTGVPVVERPKQATAEAPRQAAPEQPAEPPLVRRGEMVTVFARSAGVRVRTTARAYDDGALGEQIIVESPANRKKYVARVTGPQEAEVELASSNIAAAPAPAAASAPRPVVSQPRLDRRVQPAAFSGESR